MIASYVIVPVGRFNVMGGCNHVVSENVIRADDI